MKHILALSLCMLSLLASAQFRAIGLAKGQQCINHLKQIGIGLKLYEVDHGKAPAKLEDMKETISRTVCSCPNAKEKKEYLYLGDLGKKDDPAMPIVMDRIGNHPNEINVLFRNGQVRTIKHSSVHYKGLLHCFKNLSAQDQKKLAEQLRKFDQSK